MNEKKENFLPKSRWRPEVYHRLQSLLQSSGERRPAVFDFDNTCIVGDIGELFSHYLIDEFRYRYDLNEFWEEIHPEDGRRDLKALTDALLALPAEDRQGSDHFARYLGEMGALYERRLLRTGKRDCYEWAVRLHAGLSEEEMTRWTAEAIRREIGCTPFQERRMTSRGDLVIERGIRLIREIGELMRALERAGFEVWIVSATNIWTVRVFGAYFGIPEERVLGNRVEVVDGRLTARTSKPVLFREGKVEAIERFIGRRPALVAGDAVTDYEMLLAAEELALVIDRGDELLRSEGERRGWAFQPQEELTAVESLADLIERETGQRR